MTPYTVVVRAAVRARNHKWTSGQIFSLPVFKKNNPKHSVIAQTQK